MYTFASTYPPRVYKLLDKKYILWMIIVDVVGISSGFASTSAACWALVITLHCMNFELSPELALGFVTVAETYNMACSHHVKRQYCFQMIHRMIATDCYTHPN